MRMILSRFPSLIQKIFSPQYYATLTYYVPSPPRRSNGYQEKELDHYFFRQLQHGLRPVKIQMMSNPGSEQSGLWVMILVKGSQKQIQQIINHHPEESFFISLEKKDHKKDSDDYDELPLEWPS
jgi:hypothetical protein